MRGRATDNSTSMASTVYEASSALKQGASIDEAWHILETAELARISIPEFAGGNGGGLGDAAELLRLAGYHSLDLPVAESTMLAGQALAASGLEIPQGPLALIIGDGELELLPSGDGHVLVGTVRRVPWAREAASIVALCDSPNGAMITVLDPRECEITPGENLAGESRDAIRFDNVFLDSEVNPAGEEVDAESLSLRGALARTISIAGALDKVLELSVAHASSRQQFGRAVGKFQAVQQQLAVLAGEIAASDAAVRSTVETAGAQGIRGAATEIAAAKARVSMAAGEASGIAHQIHGAVGFTQRHELHQSTLRLWSWREEFGSEVEWAEEIGQRLVKAGGEALWDAVIDPAPALANTSDIGIRER